MRRSWKGESRSPVQGSQQAVGYDSRDAVERGFVPELAHAMRENPASAGLIAVGIAFLFLGGGRISLSGSGARDGQVNSDGGGGPDLRNAAERAASGVASFLSAARAGGAVSSVGESASTASSAAGHAAGAASSRASSAVADAYDGLGEVGKEARDAVVGARASVRETARVTSEAARRRSRQVQESLAQFLDREPWMIGALGLVAGVSLAAALPKTRAEDDWLGEASASLKGQAKDVTTKGLEAATARVERAVAEVAREARAQGLSEDAVAAAIKDFGEKLGKVASTAGERLKSEM